MPALSPFHTMETFVPENEESMYGSSFYDNGRVKCEKNTYACMKPMKTDSDLLSADPEDDLLSWGNVHPENWTPKLVLDWLFYVACMPQHNINLDRFQGEAFRDVSGQQLIAMTEDEFRTKIPEYGSLLHREFRKIITEASFVEPEMSPCESYPAYDTFNQINNNYMNHQYGGVMESDETSSMIAANIMGMGINMNKILSCEQQSESQQSFSIDGINYDIDVESSFDLFSQDISVPSSSIRHSRYDEGYSSEYPDSDRASNFSTDSTYHGSAVHMHQYVQKSTKTNKGTKRNPGRPRRYKSSVSTDDGSEYEYSDAGNHRGRRQGQGTKGNHLWEFIRDLLFDEGTNNKIIKWEDRKNGVFRFVHSEQVAKKWGSKKNNPGMTYEKLSRAMRYYYKREILERVDGRRLVYKFGKNATGWQED